MVDIQQRTVADIVDAPEFPALIEEYAAESAIPGLPPPRAKIETYRTYEAMGIFHAFTAEQAGALIGFITVVAPPMPHYSMPIAVSESFFVAAAHRKGGAGLRLLEMAEGRARMLGAPGLLVSAPFEGRLFEVLPRRGYVETSRIFFKRLYDA